MKKFLVYLAFSLSLPLSAEEPAKDDLTQLYGKLGLVSPKVVKAGYTILHVEFDRLGPGSEFTLKRDLNSKFKYKIVGVGSLGITDLQLRLIDAKGKIEATDPNKDSVAIINLSPKSSGLFTLKVGAAKLTGARPYFFCLLASKPK